MRLRRIAFETLEMASLDEVGVVGGRVRDASIAVIALAYAVRVRGASHAGRTSARSTKTSTAMGSALYMSPEQMRYTRGVDHRTDIYALGIALYELLGDARLSGPGVGIGMACGDQHKARLGERVGIGGEDRQDIALGRPELELDAVEATEHDLLRGNRHLVPDAARGALSQAAVVLLEVGADA